MKKQRTFVALMIGLLLLGCQDEEQDGWQEYVPRQWSDEAGIIENPDSLMKEHLDRLEHVLRYYGVKYRRVSDLKLLLGGSIDAATSWNFTSKANDVKWLIEHPVDNNI